jgi:CMP-N,N'-diacetyllegionaminic acid synthase
MMNKEILAIIPARGGSKGVPRKNVRELNGKPLIGYTIESAKKSNKVSRVVVTTEDTEIATISRAYKAEVPYLRPDELSQDNSPTMECVLHMLDYLEKTEGYVSDYVLLLQCTSPLRNHNHINEAIDKLLNSDYDSIISVCEAEVNPYWANIFEGDKLKYFIEEGRKITRRQELPNVYRMNGAIYLIKTEVLKKQKNFEPEEVMGYIMDSYSSVDIDTEMDFKIAEAIIKERGDV